MAASLANADLVPLTLVASNYTGPVSPDLPDMLGDPALITGNAGQLGYDELGNPVEDPLGVPLTKTYRIWGQIDLVHNWTGLGFSIHTTGDLFASATLDTTVDKWEVVATNGRFKINGTHARWRSDSDPYADSTGDNLTMVNLPPAGWSANGELGVGTLDAPTGYGGAYQVVQRGTWFNLGELTVIGTAGSVYLDYQPTTFEGGFKGDGIMYYGFGAEGIINLDENLNVASDVAFVTFLPEPASLILMALAGLIIRRR
jgi:hypothetical protein